MHILNLKSGTPYEEILRQSDTWLNCQCLCYKKISQAECNNISTVDIFNFILAE